MARRSLLPSVSRRGEGSSGDFPFFALQRDMNRMFDSLSRGDDYELFPMLGEQFSDFSPSIDVQEDDDAFTVKAELPGIDQKDVDVRVTGDLLIIKGEKKQEKEDDGKDYYCMERSYGSFRRMISLPKEVDSEKVEASFKNGVLSIKLPKTEEAKSKSTQIPVTTA